MKKNSYLRVSGALIVLGAVFLGGCSHKSGDQQNPAAQATGGSLRVYYAKRDGDHLVPYRVAEGSATDPESLAYLAAVSVLNGPPAGVAAIRFPAGTTARSVHVDGSTATVDLSKDVERTAPGGIAEAGEFKALVWTLTDIPGISQVQIHVDGAVVPTLPGGHFELDEPLSRKDW